MVCVTKKEPRASYSGFKRLIRYFVLRVNDNHWALCVYLRLSSHLRTKCRMTPAVTFAATATTKLVNMVITSFPEACATAAIIPKNFWRNKREGADDMYAKIRAVTSYLPAQIEHNSEIVDGRFMRKIGVESRHIAAADESAGDMALAAAEKIFAQYDIDRQATDFILLCTQHPDYQMPHTAAHIQSRLGLGKGVGTMDIALGCSGYVYGLAVAKGLIETGLARRVLFLTSSVYTKYINRRDTSVRPLFGDGSTATWIEAVDEDTPSLNAFVFGSDGSRFDRLIIPVGGSRHTPRETPEVFATDDQNNFRSNYEVFMDGMAITYFTLREVPQLVDDVLTAANITRADLDYCIFHQANKFMMDFLREKAGLSSVPFHNDITTTGNIVSGSVPLAIEQVAKAHGAENLRRVMLAGFGVGLSWAGCMADLSGLMTLKGAR